MPTEPRTEEQLNPPPYFCGGGFLSCSNWDATVLVPGQDEQETPAGACGGHTLTELQALARIGECRRWDNLRDWAREALGRWERDQETDLQESSDLVRAVAGVPAAGQEPSRGTVALRDAATAALEQLREYFGGDRPEPEIQAAIDGLQAALAERRASGDA